MIIGLDFDNTIVSYDALFHKVAAEKGLVAEGVAINKVAVRDHLRKAGQEPVWTEMQGYVYGARLDEAVSYPNVRSFLRWSLEQGHSINIVSHKTRHPFIGPKYDLHDSAMSWIGKHLVDQYGSLVGSDNIFFEPTKEDKISRIKDLGCEVFLDDLPEIFLATKFPDQTRRFLFDPENNYTKEQYSSLNIVRDWEEFKNYLII